MKYALMEVEGSCCEDVQLSADHGGEVPPPLLPHPTSSSTDRGQAIDPKQRYVRTNYSKQLVQDRILAANTVT